MLTVSYKGTSGKWHGTLKIGNDTVWTCDHCHKNRDQTTKWSGRSARDCANIMKILVERQDYAKACEIAGYTILPEMLAMANEIRKRVGNL